MKNNSFLRWSNVAESFLAIPNNSQTRFNIENVKLSDPETFPLLIASNV